MFGLDGKVFLGVCCRDAKGTEKAVERGGFFYHGRHGKGIWDRLGGKGWRAIQARKIPGMRGLSPLAPMAPLSELSRHP